MIDCRLGPETPFQQVTRETISFMAIRMAQVQRYLGHVDEWRSYRQVKLMSQLRFPI